MAAFVTLTLVAVFVLFCRALRKLGTGYGYIPSAELLRSLIAKPRGDKGLPDVRVRQITCCQIIIGFIGIGNMGGAISANLSNAGYHIVGYDIAGTAERVPEGATVGLSAGNVATQSDIIMMSLPDGHIVQEVTEEIIATNDRRSTTIIDVSTSGVAAARAASARCRDSEIAFYDAPVSGGVPGAKAGTISIMFAGPEEAFERLKPIMEIIGV